MNTNKKKEYYEKIDDIIKIDIDQENLPNISILIPAYNEQTSIYNKLKEIAFFEYPLHKLEVILLDDCSSDNTVNLANEAFEELNLNGKILINETRMGVNTSYNRGVLEAKYEYILTTDADISLEKGTLKDAVKILLNFKDVGGVTARMSIISLNKTYAGEIEDNYRNIYDSMLIAESSIHSTFPGYTNFTLFKKNLYSPMSPKSGSSDGNLSLSIIKHGFRYILAPQLFFYESVSKNITEQKRQKIRRASRQVQSAMNNKDIFLNEQYGLFGTKIFPLKFLMLTICPLFLFIGTLLTLTYLLLYSRLFSALSIVSIIVVIFLGIKTNISFFNFFVSILIHQFYLLIGLSYLFKKNEVWESIEERYPQRISRADSS